MEKHRIYIVEDDIKIASLLAETLRKYQYDVAIVENFEHIIEECKKQIEVVERGEFGADMKVELLNDGPFTIVLDSEAL